MVAHVLWEPLGPMRGRVGDPEHDRPSGEGTDYCAVREIEPVGDADRVASRLRDPAYGPNAPDHPTVRGLSRLTA